MSDRRSRMSAFLTEPESVERRAARARSALTERVPNPFFGIIPRSSSLGDPTIPMNQLLRPYPMYTTVSQYRNNVGTTFYQGAYVKLEQRFSRGLSYLVSYTRSKLVDDASSVFDASILTGPIANYPVADSFNRRLERDYSTGDIPHVFVASAVWELPFGAGRAHHPEGVIGALVNDWTLSGVVTMQSGIPVAVTQATNNNAFGGIRHAAPQYLRAIRPSRPMNDRRRAGSIPRPSAPRRSSHWATPLEIRCADPATAISISRCFDACRCPPATRSRCASRHST